MNIHSCRYVQEKQRLYTPSEELERAIALYHTAIQERNRPNLHCRSFTWDGDCKGRNNKKDRKGGRK
jgi:hypothetical protein